MLKDKKIKINLIYLTLLLSTLLSFTLPRKANAQVVMNGYSYQGQELATLKYLSAIGYYLGPITPGRYWLDVNTGNWGYEGNPQIQGNILMQQNNSQTSQRRSHPYERPNGDIYDPSYGGSSVTADPQTGCRYYSVGGYTINGCDKNW